MDVSSIAAMIDLESLNLEKAKVDSLEYLERCKKLQEVSINTENGPFSYAILGTLKQLKKIEYARYAIIQYRGFDIFIKCRSIGSFNKFNERFISAVVNGELNRIKSFKLSLYQ